VSNEAGGVTTRAQGGDSAVTLTVREPSKNRHKEKTDSFAAYGVSSHQRLIELWSQAWEEQFGAKYKFQGGRDAKAVKELLAYEPDPEKLVAIAVRAWNATSEKWNCCNQSSTLNKFSSKIAEIIAELNRKTPLKPNPRNEGIIEGPTKYDAALAAKRVAETNAIYEAGRLAREMADSEDGSKF
jgi:hypothetical protein